MQPHKYEHDMQEEMRDKIRAVVSAVDSISFAGDGTIEIMHPTWGLTLTKLNSLAGLVGSTALEFGTDNDYSGCDTCGGSEYITITIRNADYDRILRGGR